MCLNVKVVHQREGSLFTSKALVGIRLQLNSLKTILVLLRANYEAKRTSISCQWLMILSASTWKLNENKMVAKSPSGKKDIWRNPCSSFFTARTPVLLRQNNIRRAFFRSRRNAEETLNYRCRQHIKIDDKISSEFDYLKTIVLFPLFPSYKNRCVEPPNICPIFIRSWSHWTYRINWSQNL